jgi:mono/diheme cytochrome c family protein
MSEKPLTSWRWLSIVALATIAGIWAALSAVANAAGTDAEAGKQLFQEKTCVACHTVGKGPLVGPDLQGVTARRPREWLEQWIAAPDAMLAKKDPVAISLLHEFHDVPMPNPGLSTSDINAILDYLETAASGAAAPATAATSAPAVQGNPVIGKDLFTGVVRFHNGGPPCLACHSTGGIGALGGGQLGPDLTTVLTRYGGAAAVDAFVGGTPTPTMKAVWSQRPLTTEERASVVAFLGQAGLSERPAETIWQLAGLTVLGVVVLLAAAGFKWRNRLKFGVWRPMVARPTTGPGAFHRTIADERGQHTGPYHGGWFTGPYHPGWKASFNVSDNERPRGPANAPRRGR